MPPGLDDAERAFALVQNQSKHFERASHRNTRGDIRNFLWSIIEDSNFVEEVTSLAPEIPVFGNLRCGVWYSKNAPNSCYFKSTDGHNEHWSFSLRRLNLNVAKAAIRFGGAFIVDATRSGKRFPDSLSKTVPIWCAVLNRVSQAMRMDLSVERDTQREEGETNTQFESGVSWEKVFVAPGVFESEERGIEERLSSMAEALQKSGCDLSEVRSERPFRCLWVSPNSLLAATDFSNLKDLPFIPIICISASKVSKFEEGGGERRSHGWTYIQGGADDEESWARGLTPSLFWENVSLFENQSISATECEALIAELVLRVSVTSEGSECGSQCLHCIPNGIECSPTRIADFGHVQISMSRRALANCRVRTSDRVIVDLGARPLQPTPHLVSIPIDMDVKAKTRKFNLLNRLDEILHCIFKVSATSPCIVITGDDEWGMGVASCVVAAIIVSHSLQDSQTVCTKEQVTRALLRVQSKWPESRPPRLLTKQLHRHFIPHDPD